MNETWSAVWQLLQARLLELEHCKVHPAFPCIKTLRRPVTNDILQVTNGGIVARSHRTNRETEIAAKDLELWWEQLSSGDTLCIDPQRKQGDDRAPTWFRPVLVGAIFVMCLADKIRFIPPREISLRGG